MRMKRYNQSRVEQSAQKTISILRGTITTRRQLMNILRLMNENSDKSSPLLVRLVDHSYDQYRKSRGTYRSVRNPPVMTINVNWGTRSLEQFSFMDFTPHDISLRGADAPLYFGKSRV